MGVGGGLSLSSLNRKGYGILAESSAVHVNETSFYANSASDGGENVRISIVHYL
jgi:hypothetical protein